MTADSSDNETQSRLTVPNPSEGRNQSGQDVARPQVREGVKSGIWKDRTDRDRHRGDSGSGGDGDPKNACSGSADLNARLKYRKSVGQKFTERNGETAVQSRHENEKPMATRDGRTLDSQQTSDEERDEETEDDLEEGDPAPPPVASKTDEQQVLQQQPHQVSGKAGKPVHGNLQEQGQQQPPPQNSPANEGWESFLPRKNLKILLAEDDDSTRHVVGALLRNCSYEVTSAANGMQAWELLEDPENCFDLVLTDVVMPCLSGVGLLTKIMGREAGKRIPVIMMSSHDSLDIVFRCLSKGAADFLVKPVRKNELKNLWQHVWRCQSSSGSGSGGSGYGMGKVGRPKSRVGSGANSVGNDDSEDGSSGLNVRGGSDNGSGTQTVAVQVQTREKQKRDREEGQATSLQKLSVQQMGQDLEMATRRPGTVELREAAEQAKHRAENGDQNGDFPSPNDRQGADRMDEGYNSGGAANSGGSSAKAIDLIGGIACQNNENVKEGEESDGAEGSDRGDSNSPVPNEKYISSSNSLPTLELSLKRSRVSGDDEVDADAEERRVVRQSCGSAFSRYSTSGTIMQQYHPSGNPISPSGYPMAGAYGGSYGLSSGQTCTTTNNPGQPHLSTPLDRSGSSKGNAEASPAVATHPHPSQRDSGQDMGSGVVGTSGQEGHGTSRQVKDESGEGMPMPIPLPPPGMMYEGASTGYGQSMHPTFYPHPAAPQWAAGTSHMSNRGEVFDHPPFREHGPHMSHYHSHSHSNHHPHNHPQHHHHQHSHMPQSSLRCKPDEQTVTTQAAGAPRCGSSSATGTDGNPGQSGSSNGYGSNGNCNGSVNGSASGSNNLNNQNGQSGVALPAGANGDSAGNNGVPGTGAVDPEQNRFARREAALNKFRQKRKERCFEKKVRYQSRKRLAEQRPRVRGQFVRQTVYDTNAGEGAE